MKDIRILIQGCSYVVYFVISLTTEQDHMIFLGRPWLQQAKVGD